jgi:ATP-binding cassette, subfamily B (MDR/TAP), member 7
VAAAGKPSDDKVQKDIPKKDVDNQIADTQILKNLAKYLLLNDSPDFRFRVVLSLGLLIGAKVNGTCFEIVI